ncbi:MAG: hypothetical protein R2939_09380 [Kofleriaceae bacterium]
MGHKLSLPLAGLFGLGALTLAACGDNDENLPADAAPGSPDASAPADAAPMATRSATIAVTQATVTKTTGPSVGGPPPLQLTGGSFSIDFQDVSGTQVPPVFGDGSIGSCTVFKYTAGTNGPPPSVDEGAVTINGAGLLKPNPNPCTFSAAAGEYLCIAGGGAGVGGSVSSPGAGGPGTANVTITGATFGAATQAEVGMYLDLSGTGVANYTGQFPIVGVAGVSTLVIGGPFPGLAATPFAAGTYGLIQGAGPVPGSTSPLTPKYLDDAASPADVHIEMAASAAYPDGIDIDLEPIAAGLTLSSTGGFLLPHQFPTTAADAPFSCAAADGGDCGNDPSTGDLKAFIITGRTTTGDLSGRPVYDMPPPAAGDEYTTFTCSFLSPSTKGTIPQAAVAAILDTTPAPTRIETRVIRANGSTTFQGPGAVNQLNILVGQALVGHTDVPPSTAR